MTCIITVIAKYNIDRVLECYTYLKLFFTKQNDVSKINLYCLFKKHKTSYTIKKD